MRSYPVPFADFCFPFSKGVGVGLVVYYPIPTSIFHPLPTYIPRNCLFTDIIEKLSTIPRRGSWFISYVTMKFPIMGNYTVTLVAVGTAYNTLYDFEHDTSVNH